MTNTENETRSHIHRVQELMYRLVNLLLERCETHDKSKLSEPEKSGFEKMDAEPYYPYGSQEYFDKLDRYAPILEHHYKLNPHHPEHYSGFIAEMDLLDILEMVCDWASRRGGLSANEMISLVEQQSERFSIPSELSSILLNTMQRYLVAEENPEKPKWPELYPHQRGEGGRSAAAGRASAQGSARGRKGAEAAAAKKYQDDKDQNDSPYGISSLFNRNSIDLSALQEFI